VIDYTEFDAQVLARIRAGVNSFVGLQASDLRKQAEALVGNKDDAWRLIDRRLQALRKKGLVVYERKTGWRET
jgi:hypothetical protein